MRFSPPSIKCLAGPPSFRLCCLNCAQRFDLITARSAVVVVMHFAILSATFPGPVSLDLQKPLQYVYVVYTPCQNGMDAFAIKENT